MRANATICLKNGSPIPQGLITAGPEPSEGWRWLWLVAGWPALHLLNVSQ